MMMRVASVAGFLVCLSLWSTKALADEKPLNVILIMCDDMGFEGVSAYGSLNYKTPHLDALAKSGALFEHCYSQPICTPSRVQIMTGKYNHRNYTKFGALNTKEVTFGHVMKQAGYHTAITGKWQLGGDGQTVQNFGFDEHCLWHLGGRESRYWNPRIVTNGKLQVGPEDAFGPDVVCDFLLDFVERKRNDKFFAYYPMMLPHWPFVPTPDSPPGGSRERLGKYDGQNGGVEYFDDMVAYVDKNVGRIVRKLEDLKLRENTLILFTCDNGCATNLTSRLKDRVIKGGKGSMTDAGTHVALVASCPSRIPAGQVLDTLVDFSDMLPTITHAANAPLPTSLKLDGQSFWPQLTGEKANPREWVFCHYIRNGLPRKPNNKQKQQQAIAKQEKARKAKQLGRYVRDQQYKLYEDGRFYHVTADYEEANNIAEGTGTPEAETARKKFQTVFDSIPPWQPFKTTDTTK